MSSWKKYYWRMIGYAMSGAGAGLMIDELIEGPFMLTPTDHEFWGLLLFIGGVVCIAKCPKGK